MRNKVPEISLAFWAIKVCAAMLGETFGDFLSMTLQLGYAFSAAILLGFFIVTLAAQFASKNLHPFVYWSVIVATTMLGNTMADYLDRTSGLGYIAGSALLAVLLVGVLALWRFTTGSVSVNNVTTPKVEMFYWTAVLISNTLGTALGDCLSTSSGLGFQSAALVFGGLLALVALAYFFTHLSHTLLFWLAFVLTRPLGATLADSLTKPLAEGGLNLGRMESSLVIAAFIIVCILLTSERSEQPQSHFAPVPQPIEDPPTPKDQEATP
jgi:uncharacterized membrane-anchored protein